MDFQEQATATAKYGGLSTSRQTMRLSVASVEMTCFFGWVERGQVAA
jgi:hypothetical protein